MIRRLLLGVCIAVWDMVHGLSNCGGNMKSSGFIQSPGYGGLYPNNVSCTWTLTADTGMIVQLEFYEFEVQNGSDVLRVYNSTTICPETFVNRFSGVLEPATRAYFTSSVALVFSSDDTIQDLGFLILFASVNSSASSSPQSLGPCQWSGWSVNECNCSDGTYWSSRTCTADGAFQTPNLTYIELETFDCSSHCQYASSSACHCETMGQRNDTWECRNYECMLHGYEEVWSQWTTIKDCGESFRNREMRCLWTNVSTIWDRTPTCGEKCIACIADPTTQECDVCASCNDTLFTVDPTTTCASMFALEVENVSCGMHTAWSQYSDCSASYCRTCTVGVESRRRYCHFPDPSTPEICADVVTLTREDRPCNMSNKPVGDIPAVLPPVKDRQVSKPKAEAPQAPVVGGSFGFIALAFILFILVLDAPSLAQQTYDRMIQNVKRAYHRKRKSRC